MSLPVDSRGSHVSHVFAGVWLARACRRSVEGGRHGDGREGEDEGEGRPHSQARHERLHQQVIILRFCFKRLSCS